MSKIIIFGTSCNPFGNHHLRIIRALLEKFGRVLVYPCGNRPEDKPSTLLASPRDKIEMLGLGLLGTTNVFMDCHDLVANTFTPTWKLDQIYKKEFPKSEVWHVVGGDLVQGGANINSEIQKKWQRGKEVWSNLNWVVIHHPGCTVNGKDLPPHSELVKLPEFGGRSTYIRNRVRLGISITDLVPPKVEKYILKHNLYK